MKHKLSIVNCQLSIILMVALFASPLKAQVKIGDQTAPQKFSALELTTEKIKAGLRLPQLTTDQRDALVANPNDVAKGLMIYNTDTNCVDFWNGSKWISMCDNTTTTATTLAQPGPITGVADVCPSGATQNYSVGAVTGATSYVWTLPDGWTESSTGNTGTFTTTIPSITVTPALPSSVTFNASLNQSTVGGTVSVIADDASGDASPASVLSVTTYNGCCAATASGSYLKFMCYNLGADESLDPFTYNSINDSTSYDIKGWAFQWGRPADGHQYRSSGATSTLSSNDTPGNNLFISAPTTPYDWRNPPNDMLWNSGTETAPVKATNDPCPSGWRVPTSSEWINIYYAADGYSTNVNTWEWSGSSTAGGYKVGNALYLPAAGWHDYINGLSFVGSNGAYWSSTPISTYANYLYFGSRVLVPADSNYREEGFSVRCIAE